MESKKSALMLAVMDGLKKKGKTGRLKSSAEEDGDVQSDTESGPDAHLASISGDLIEAIEQKDSKAVAELLREAFEYLDSEPHEEGEHLS
jgi:hypothetical protein